VTRSKSDGKSLGRSSARRRHSEQNLQLVRVEPAGRHALNLVFRGGAEEQAWRLENTTVVEFFALLLHGKMGGGRRITLPDAELTLEPPETRSENPSFCLAMGPLEVWSPVNRAGMKALKADLERSLKG
jgi:hypothetical protein